jgi:pyrroloquinoline quinone biosynthesis protein B
MKIAYSIALVLICFGCNSDQSIEANSNETTVTSVPTTISKTSIVILGNVQDGGSPHIGCKKDCCKDLFNKPDESRKVVCLGVIDPENRKSYLFEATPDMTKQMKWLKKFADSDDQEIPDGIFLTHAHIGHYTGLMYLGKEATNADKAPVYAMPGMKQFLETNGPWSQLVSNQNILINDLKNEEPVELTSNLQVIPFTVPHRDEYSETVGYEIVGPSKRALFIPDIDKWGKWEKDIVEEIKRVDYAFIDATFFDGEEINNRDIAEIPHPFIIESMELFKNLSAEEKGKIVFIHFNHTNPALNPESPQTKEILKNGFSIARLNDQFEL